VRWATTIQRGIEFPSTLPWPKTSPAYDDAKANGFQFDLDKACEPMLDAAKEFGARAITAQSVVSRSFRARSRAPTRSTARSAFW
jgi:hypothetical protein